MLPAPSAAYCARRVAGRCRICLAFKLLLLSLVRPGASAEAGASLLFDGANDFATGFPGFAILSEWTIEAWLLPTQLLPERCVLCMRTFGLRHLLTVKSSSTGAWSVIFGAEEIEIPASDWLGGGYESDSVSVGQHHLALTHEALGSSSSRLSLYLNSTLRASWEVNTSLTAAIAAVDPALPTLLGACYRNGRGSREGEGRGIFRSAFFAGHMDEVRWWGRALSSAEIEETWRLSGDADMWTVAGDGYRASSPRKDDLQAQYSFDVVGARIHDGSGKGKDGLLGTKGDEVDSPRALESAFGDALSLGSIYFRLREEDHFTLDFESFMHSAAMRSILAEKFGIPFAGVPTTGMFRGLRLLRGLRQPSLGTALHVTGDSASPLSAASLVTGMTLDITTGAAVEHDDFAVQACLEAGNATSCEEFLVYEVTIVVERSQAPVAGPAHALELSRRGGAVLLPRVPQDVTVEFWMQLLPPTAMGTTIFAIYAQSGADMLKEVVRLWLDTDTTETVLDVCSNSSSEPTRFRVSGGLISEAPQHVAVSFRRDGGGGYAILLHSDCVELLAAAAPDPCYWLDSPDLWRPTLGQRYMHEVRILPWPLSDSFAQMRLAEVRAWDHERSAAELCAAWRGRLAGDEPGLIAYSPVVAADAATSASGVRRLTLTSAMDTGVHPAGVPLPDVDSSIEVLCTDEFDVCPHLARGVGFSFRPSPFDLPPDVVTLQTTGRDAFTITLTGDDPDNYMHFLPESLGLDTWRFEITQPPDEECIFTFESSVTRYNSRMTATSSCTSCGNLPTRVIPPSLEPLSFLSTCPASACREAPRTILPPASMPLRFEPSVPFPCTTEMKYRTVDAHGRASGQTATVRLEVLTARLTILSVIASDSRANSGGLQGGVVLNFTFSEATTAPPVNVHRLFEVINGSWGQDLPSSQWLDGNRSLLVLLGDGAEETGTDLTIGLTRFQVLETADLRKQDDALSAPCNDISPELGGNFTAHICNPGEVYNFTAGGLCDDCVPGTYWAVVEAKPTCLACPSGQFSDQAAQTACSSCTPGTYLPDDSADRTACLLAPPGFFVEGYEEAVAEPCMDGALAEQAGHSQCYVCPVEADCLVPGYERRLPLAKPDFFRMDNGSFARCTVEAACTGSGVCAEGHQDASLGCYPCSKGWSRGVGALHGSSSCWKCPSLLMIILRIFAVLVGSSLLVLYLAAINITAAHRLACLHPFVLKIGLGHLLLMNTLTNFAEWELQPCFGKATALIHALVGVLLGWDGMVPLRAIPVECLLEHFGGDGLARTWAALGLWLFLAGLLLLCCLAPPLMVLWLLRWRRRKRSSAARSKAKVTAARRGPESGKAGDNADAREDVDAKLASIVPTAVNIPDDDDEDIIYDPTVVPVGWEAHYSDKHHKYYYYNSDREFSTWSHPVVQMAATSSRTKKAPPDGIGTTSRDTNPKAFATAKEIDNDALEARFCGIWRKHLVALPADGWYQAFLADSEGVIIVAALLLYPAVLRQLLVPLRCDVLSGVAGKPRLLVAPELECGASEHRGIAGFAWLTIVLWGLGFPALFVLIAWRSRRTLHNFWTSVRIGVLVAEYETKFFFWESVILLRRFAVLSVVVLAPPTRPVFRLILLLAIGVASTIMHSHNEPFDNRSGTLLDQLEERGLLIFCATTAAFILGFSQLMHPTINTVILVTTLAMHVLFLLQLLAIFLRFMRRSMADGVVEEHMQQGGESTYSCDFPFCCFKRCCRRLHERMFMQEADAQREKAQIFYDTQQGLIMLQPSSTGREPGDEEQHFLVTGLADCIAHAVTDLRIELLSMHFLEYLGRQAFAEHHRRSQVWGEVHRKLARRYKLPAVPEKQKQELPLSPTSSQKSGGGEEDKRRSLHFSEQTFSRGMPASDFQGYLNSISQYPWDHLLQTFHHFMVAKDTRFIDYTLAPRDRMIRKLFAHQAQAPGRLRRLDEKDADASEDTGSTALEGSPPRSFLADTDGSDNAKKDAEPVLEFDKESGDESDGTERPLSAKASSLADNLFSHLRRESHMLTPPASAGSTAAGSAADNTGFGTRAGTASDKEPDLTATISLNTAELLGEQRPQEDIPGAMPSDGPADEALSPHDSEISWVPMPFTDAETAAPLHHFWRRDNEPWNRNAAVVGL